MKQNRVSSSAPGRFPGQAPPVVLVRRLLAWYDRHRRDLPWRAPPGERPEPYRVWLSEIMLQQTTVATVGPYFRAFLARWPTVDDLARADLQAVLHAWQGLGYYSRARNLHKCAGVVVGDYGGRFPDTEAGLRALPGIGTYTAAAVAAIAFDRPAAPVDGNVERVVARLLNLASPRPQLKRQVAELAHDLTPPRRAGDFWQAVMDLGATVCRPRNPGCGVCPWMEPCMGRRMGRPEDLPVRSPRKARPLRYGVAFWGIDAAGAVLLRRRPEKGLLGGMTEVPTTAWRERPWSVEEALASAPGPGDWIPLAGRVRHTFTHFELELTVLAATGLGSEVVDGIWCPPEGLAGHALPTVMRKVVDHARRSLLEPAVAPADSD